MFLGGTQKALMFILLHVVQGVFCQENIARNQCHLKIISDCYSLQGLACDWF